MKSINPREIPGIPPERPVPPHEPTPERIPGNPTFPPEILPSPGEPVQIPVTPVEPKPDKEKQ